jgi:hypothetical protein
VETPPKERTVVLPPEAGGEAVPVAGAEIAETAADLAGVVETGIGVSFDLIRSSFCVPEVNFLRERFLFPEFVKKSTRKIGRTT